MALAPNTRLALISAVMESGPPRQQAAAEALGEVWFEKNKRIFTVVKGAEHVGQSSKTQSSSCLKQFRNHFSWENCLLFMVQRVACMWGWGKNIFRQSNSTKPQSGFNFTYNSFCFLFLTVQRKHMQWSSFKCQKSVSPHMIAWVLVSQVLEKLP